MPIYEYRCRSCGAVSEFLTGLGKDEQIACRNCASKEMVKIISASSFIASTMERTPGHTCCGREDRCETPPCSSGGGCTRD